MIELEARKIIEAGAGSRKMWEQEFIEAILYLVAKNRTEPPIMENLTYYISEGYEKTKLYNEIWSGDDIGKITTAYLPRNIQALIQLLETNNDALQYMTKLLIDGYAEMPIYRYEVLISTFLSITPQNALPQTRESINRLLRSKLAGTNFATKLRDLRNQLPNASFTEKLFGWFS